MIYDQVGQMMAIVNPKTGLLYREGVDFRALDPADEGFVNLEDGIMVDGAWLKSAGNKEILIRFLKVSLLTLRERGVNVVCSRPGYRSRFMLGWGGVGVGWGGFDAGGVLPWRVISLFVGC